MSNIRELKNLLAHEWAKCKPRADSAGMIRLKVNGGKPLEDLMFMKITDESAGEAFKPCGLCLKSESDIHI